MDAYLDSHKGGRQTSACGAHLVGCDDQIKVGGQEGRVPLAAGSMVHV